jgi:hypothetical protein
MASTSSGHIQTSSFKRQSFNFRVCTAPEETRRYSHIQKHKNNMYKKKVTCTKKLKNNKISRQHKKKRISISLKQTHIQKSKTEKKIKDSNWAHEPEKTTAIQR